MIEIKVDEGVEHLIPDEVGEVVIRKGELVEGPAVRHLNSLDH